jgi:Raf kinase inhibitor-like YbhB/YbcL family protein
MKVNPRTGLAAASLAVVLFAADATASADAPDAHKGTRTAAKLTLTSADIQEGKTITDAQVFNSLGCSGKNISPALAWSGAPSGTKSFVLMVHDPDAPTRGGFWHWIVYNIPADVTSLSADAGDPNKKLMPPGAIQGRSDFGAAGYGGPCPPPGEPHHYHFRLYALKVAKLDVPEDAAAALINSNAKANELQEADLMGLYGR